MACRSTAELPRDRGGPRVGVGIMIAHNPLHGSGQAGFPHPALALGDNAHAAQGVGVTDGRRSEERRGGEEGRSRWGADHLKKKKTSAPICCEKHRRINGLKSVALLRCGNVRLESLPYMTIDVVCAPRQDCHIYTSIGDVTCQL